jgi:hypothetical protein
LLIRLHLAGLLAWLRVCNGLPGKCQWHGGCTSSAWFGKIEIYSYGDSAGIAPDFPFNPGAAARGPNARQRWAMLFYRQMNLSVGLWKDFWRGIDHDPSQKGHYLAVGSGG